MLSSKVIDIEKEHAIILREILRDHLPIDAKVFAFGSRAKGEARYNSDLDLALLGDNTIDKTIVELKESLYESDIPYKVDIINLLVIKNDFKQIIQNDMVPILWDWQEFQLGEIGFFRGGVTSIKKEDYGYGTPFIQYMNVYKNWKVDVDNLELMNVRTQDLERKDCKYGDVFFTASSETEDEVAISSVLLSDVSSLTFNGFCKRYRLFDFDALLPEYARYLFRSKYFRNEVYKRVTGDVRFNISQESLAGISITIPPTNEQKTIAEVLSSLDDKIDLLHRQNKTLEDTAQLLFRQWFEKNAEENRAQGTLKDEMDIVMGQSPPGSTLNEEEQGIAMYQGNADFGFRFPKKRVYTTQPSRHAEKHDTLISVRAPVGAQNMAMERCCIGRGVAAFRYKHNPDFYTYTYYKLMSLIKIIKQYDQEGTVFGSISRKDFEELENTIPPVELVRQFQETARPIDEKITTNTHQITTLENLRNALLPQLISGKVRVK